MGKRYKEDWFYFCFNGISYQLIGTTQLFWAIKYHLKHTIALIQQVEYVE